MPFAAAFRGRARGCSVACAVLIGAAGCATKAGESGTSQGGRASMGSGGTPTSGNGGASANIGGAAGEGAAGEQGNAGGGSAALDGGTPSKPGQDGAVSPALEGGLDGSGAVRAPFRVITLDGQLNDWQTVAFVSVTPDNGVFDAEASATADASDLSYRFAVAYDQTALYVAVEVTDDALQSDSTEPSAIVTAPSLHEPWKDDAVEVFLDGNNNDAPNNRSPEEKPTGGEFSLVHDGSATSDESGVPGAFGATGPWYGRTRVSGKQVVYEYRLNWSVMGQPKQPANIGFNLSVQDDDDGVDRDHALYWRGMPDRPWMNEAHFGQLVFLPR